MVEVLVQVKVKRHRLHKARSKGTIGSRAETRQGRETGASQSKARQAGFQKGWLLSRRVGVQCSAVNQIRSDQVGEVKKARQGETVHSKHSEQGVIFGFLFVSRSRL